MYRKEERKRKYLREAIQMVEDTSGVGQLRAEFTRERQKKKEKYLTVMM